MRLKAHKKTGSKSFRKIKKRETGFEPATFALARRRSTSEPFAHILHVGEDFVSFPLTKAMILLLFLFVNPIVVGLLYTFHVIYRIFFSKKSCGKPEYPGLPHDGTRRQFLWN